jgi:hypothetical protein
MGLTTKESVGLNFIRLKIELIMVGAQGFNGSVGKPLAGGMAMLTSPPHSKMRLSNCW